VPRTLAHLARFSEIIMQNFAASRLLALGIFTLVLCSAAVLSTPTALGDEAVADKPLALKDLNGHFPMTVPATREQWESRAEELRLQVKIALGIHPLPPLSKSEPVIYGKREMDGYSIEKMYFESLPGFFVTGSLYRPLSVSKSAKSRPAVLYAHGHWDRGRFYEAGEGEVRQLIATGAERFENAAINHMQAACVQLARMGCVVFQFDMIGYADSQQISFNRAHLYGSAEVNPTDDSAQSLLFSARAEGYGQSIMGLQTINAIAAVGAIGNLPDVDASRIAITGASGGGTQSFLTSAVEPRLAASFPAVMVSTGMQGGCTCENACGLRIDTGNIEIAALTAPRPLGMTTAKDWTLNMPEDGFPELRTLYGLVGKESAVELFPGPQFPHNYNHVARVGMYGFMNRAFGLGLSEPILERDFELIRASELTVWDNSHPAPASGLDFERSLTKTWTGAIENAIWPSPQDSEDDRARKQSLLREGWRTLTAHASVLAGKFDVEVTDDSITLVNQSNPSRLLLKSKATASQTHVNLLICDDEPGTNVEQLLASVKDEPTAAYLCEVVDPAGGDRKEQPLVNNPRRAAAYTFGYNTSRINRKLAAVIRLAQAAAQQANKPLHLHVNADDLYLAAAAKLQLPEGTVSKIIVTGDRDEAFQKFRGVKQIVDNDFLPGSLRYQDVEGLAAVVEEIQFRE
jgi:dienelactone hydrolase